MALSDPEDLAFERAYTSKFESLGALAGLPIHYDWDLATLDVGFHLIAGGEVTNNRVWFQLKGIYTATLCLEKFDCAQHVAYSVKIEHLRAWYKAPEAVYLVLYIQSADMFLAEDVRDIVRRQWGDELLNDSMFKPGQESTTVKLLKSARVDESFWARLRGHQSMRADGRMFRGRPLGHDLDPLRTTLNPMEPALFENVIRDLLSEHGYRPVERIEAGCLFPNAPQVDIVSLDFGVLHEMFEIKLQITNEMIPDWEDGYRIEGASDYAHGRWAVLIHSGVRARPSVQGLQALAAELVGKRNVTDLLAFVNAPFSGSLVHFGAYVEPLRNSKLRCCPLFLDDVTFNFLTTTNTYKRFCDKVSYLGHNLWRKQNGPLYLLGPNGGPPIPSE